MYDFDRPSERRYGDAIFISVHSSHYYLPDHLDSPYESSTDQRTDTPKKPMVMMGRRVARGPDILEVPCHCVVVEWESARGSGKPVMSSLARLRGGRNWSEH